MASSAPPPPLRSPLHVASHVKPGLTASDLPRRFGRYVLLRRIAKGGMGEVMLAASLGLEGAERPIIIKTIRAEHRTDQSFNARFLDEARVQAQLTHIGVAQVLDATTEEESGEPYVAVEHIDGRSLGDVRARALSSGKGIEWHEAVAICQMIAEALAHVHDREDAQGRPLSIVHRDLSPQNVMVSHGGDVKIIDFGTARGENRRCHTVSGVVYAKPGYTAPEVANSDPGDFRADLYALGVMLWELCAGRRFLDGDASDHLASVAQNERNLPPVAVLCGAPLGVDAVIAKLTAFDRDRRYPRTRNAARELAALLSDSPGLANGERGVRARTAALMGRLFEGESAKNRLEFERLVAEARKMLAERRTPMAPASTTALALAAEGEGVLPGTRYRLVREIGRGARSVVYEAEHRDLGRSVALKIVSKEHAASDDACERVRREAKVLASLAIPGVVPLIDVGETLDGRPFAVLELLSGETLDARIERTQGLPWREALELTFDLLGTLGRVHDAGVVHRDVKPANLFVGESGGVTVLDFGIALSASHLSALDTPARSRAGVAIFGTPEYMAPEQAARPDEVDARADVYAVGAILYELLTGRLPFVHESAVSLLEQKAQGSPEPPDERAPTRRIPSSVSAIAMKALARHSSLRYPSAASMRTDIQAALAEPVALRKRRRTSGAVALGAVMLFATGLLAARGQGLGGALEDFAQRIQMRVTGEPDEVAGNLESPLEALLVTDEKVASTSKPAFEVPAEPLVLLSPRPEPTYWPMVGVEAASDEPEAKLAEVERPKKKVRRAEKKKKDAAPSKERRRKGKRGSPKPRG